MNRVYKLLRGPEWSGLKASASFKGSAVDLQDGFIHLSTAAQVRETAAKHFAGAADLVLAEVDAGLLPRPLQWEKSRGGRLFPHLYAELPLSAVTRNWELALGADGRHIFPADVP